MIRFLQRHRSLAGLVVRGPVRRWVSRRVWAEVLRDPATVAVLRAGLRDMETLGFKPFRHRRDPAYWRRRGVL